MPGESGEPVVTMLVCLLSISHARLRVHQAPGIPHALSGAEVNARLGRIRVARMRTRISAVIACDKREAFAHGSECDEAIHLCGCGRGLLRCARNDEEGRAGCFAPVATTAIEWKASQPSLPATNAKRLRTGAQATKQSSFLLRGAMDCFASARNDDDGADCEGADHRACIRDP